MNPELYHYTAAFIGGVSAGLCANLAVRKRQPEWWIMAGVCFLVGAML